MTLKHTMQSCHSCAHLPTLHVLRTYIAGKLPVGDNWTACLELPVCMLGLVLPKDFTKFKSFVVWRDTLSHVLLATAQQAVRDAWAPKDGSANAQRLLAR